MPKVIRLIISNTETASPWLVVIGYWFVSNLLPITTAFGGFRLESLRRDDIRGDALYHRRVVDTAVVAVPEVQLSWVTPCSASERLNVGTQLWSRQSSFGDARLL